MTHLIVAITIKDGSIRALAKEGLTKGNIAERLGISERSVFRVLAMPRHKRAA